MSETANPRPGEGAPDEAPGLRQILEPDREPLDLDDVDRQLLQHLHEDARQPIRTLAAEVGMSAPAVAERIARLERGHVIRRRTIELDWAALGYPLLVVMPIKLTASADALDVITELRKIPSLTEVLVLASRYDLMARFRVRDHADLQRLLIEHVWTIPGIEDSEAMISIGRLADQSPLRHVLALDDASPTSPTPTRRRRS
ncbi:Lrp/AsnC family transcriptional regulator [Microbacterium sp.]|uniref:Lrp/AsnC family transcriptional regulator n=1 Tax=Microbacterium sp. TaxID=51671 RepID=UPI0039E3CA6F